MSWASRGVELGRRQARVAARALVRRPSTEPPPEWSAPPRRTPLDGTVTVRVLGSQRLRAGLGEVWCIVDQTFPHPADLAVVELVDGRLPELRRDHLATPYVVWATVGGPPETDGANGGPDHRSERPLWPEEIVDVVGLREVIDGAAAVFVADADQLDAWRAIAPAAELLAPAASSRVLPVRDRVGVAVVVSGPTSPAVAGVASTVVARALRPLEDQLVARRLETGAPLPKVVSQAVAGDGSYADTRQAITHAAVLADGLRRTRGDTWTVLDAAAAGTPVVTVDGLPTPLAVATAATEQDYRAELVARLQQAELRDREGLQLRREVLSAHTWGHRAAVISEAIGLDKLDRRGSSSALGRRGASVSAIVPTNRTHELDNVLANLARQRHTDTELVLVLHGLEVDEAELRKRAADAGIGHLELVAAPASYTLGACLNAGIERASGEVIAKMDDDNHYGAHYLTDLLHGFETSGAEIVGKWAHYVWLQSTGAVVLRYPDAEHTYQRRIQGGSMLFDGDLLRALRFGDLPRAVDSDVLDRALAEGVKVWSGDRFNYVSIRGVDRTAHTWTVSDATFLTASGRLEFYGDPRPHVEV